MKLIIAGAAGFVATEVLRQSLQKPEITSVVALTRREVDIPEGTDVSKLKVVQVKDYDEYPEEVAKEFDGAGGCIW
jgi:dTDP-4-dehydrorhamnose reductase